MQTLGNKTETQTALIARLVRDLIRTGDYETLADLTDALKARCTQLRIAWTADDISAAFRLIASNTPLVLPPVAAPPVREVETTPPTQREAVQILARVGIQTPPIKLMPKARIVSAAKADRLKALAMVIREIEESDARCAALEAAVDDEQGSR